MGATGCTQAPNGWSGARLASAVAVAGTRAVQSAARPAPVMAGRAAAGPAGSVTARPLQPHHDGRCVVSAVMSSALMTGGPDPPRRRAGGELVAVAAAGVEHVENLGVAAAHQGTSTSGAFAMIANTAISRAAGSGAQGGDIRGCKAVRSVQVDHSTARPSPISSSMVVLSALWPARTARTCAGLLPTAGLIALTCDEIGRLLNRLIIEPTASLHARVKIRHFFRVS
jgi:hypothetical protein